MKKGLLHLMMLVAAVSMMSISCTKEEENENGSGSNTDENYTIVGTWLTTAQSYQGALNAGSDSLIFQNFYEEGAQQFVFNEDGTGTVTFNYNTENPGSQETKWWCSEGCVFIEYLNPPNYHPASYTHQYKTLELTESKLTIECSEEVEGGLYESILHYDMRRM